MNQIPLFADWHAPPVDFRPEEMVATTSILGEPAAVIMLGGEAWMGVVQVAGARRVVMWEGVQHRHAVTRVVQAAGDLGLRVLPALDRGTLRVGRVPIVVTHRHLQGGASRVFKLEAGPGVQVVSAGEQVRSRDVRSGLLEAVRRGRVEVHHKAQTGRWL